MKLYYYPGACSMAVHIALREAGYAFDLDKVDLAAKTTAGGEDYNQVNAKGYVPALRLDDGEVLTEVAAILQYLADHKPDAGLAPPAGSLAHYRLLEWLNFIATEIHKTLGALFNPQAGPDWKADRIALFTRRAGWLDGQLADRPFLMGTDFSVADAYLFTVLRWCGLMQIDLGPWPGLRGYMARIAERPAVQAAMQAEGLTGG
ncbi:MAG: glutathione transferase GstA [Gallionellaceae bacterium]|nr:glutathione transferase GstA [Gallionellaceae bacterium]